MDANTMTENAARTCLDSGCGRDDILRCSYVDHAGARCGTAWCAEHAVTYFGQSYCIRHASAVAAVGENAATLPELNDRGASLAHWVASDLDAVIRGVLDRARNQFEETIFTAPVQPARSNGHTAWQRSWWLEGENGPTMRVAIAAAGAERPEVQAIVDAEIVDRAMPPWIAHRLRGEAVTPLQDHDDRRDFERHLSTSIAMAVQERRPARTADVTLRGSARSAVAGR